jgi:hypothetical protein
MAGAGGVPADGGLGGDDAGTNPSARTLGCARWVVSADKATSATVEIAGGALLFRRPQGGEQLFGPFNGADVAVEQAGLTGDFDVKIDWRRFQPGGGAFFNGPRASAGVWWTPDTYQASAGVGTGTGTATIVHGKQFELDTLPNIPASLVDAAGSFEIQRAAGSVTVTTIVNGQTVTAHSTEPFPEQPLTLYLAIGNLSGPDEMGTASVEFTRVTVTGGGGQVKSDDFSCAGP